MNSVKQYLMRLKRGVLHRGEDFALEGGISFGPGTDPKGSFYDKPHLSIYWYQPDSATHLDKKVRSVGLVKGLIMKLGSLRMSA